MSYGTFGDVVFEQVPLGKNFKGGIKSDGLWRKVYFVGIIDILQKFNFAQHKQIFTNRPTSPTSSHHEPPASLSGLFSAQEDGKFSEDVRGTTSFDGVPSLLSDRMEISVEEPGRYAKRLLEYLDRIIV
ncbi:hypothetical protein BC829DRAFT_395789 [Chytridium lagenaria]|nr:hypothetical protein BC829DRAFT_395789 [Chytridium lagenaria]